MSDNRKKDADTTAAHRKRIIDLLKKQKFLGDDVSTLWVNTYSCAVHCRCATALFSLSVLPQYHNIIIDRGISAPGHGSKVVDGMNATDTMLIFHLMATVQLTDSKRFDTQIAVHTAAQNTDVSLALEFQKHFSNE